MKKYYYSIGEVSNLLNIKAHVLRYWEKEFPQLKPRKVFGRNRKYSLEDIEIIKTIQHMLHEQKFTIEGAKKKLASKLKEKKQIELEFVPDKKGNIQEIIKELKEVRDLLKY